MILDGLNSEQKNAVLQTEGPILIVAGAGSGKTKTITHKIAYLIEQGVSPYSILALTFTNKAATEMKERIIQLVGYEAKKIPMGTFHSVFSKILRVDGKKIDFESNYTIYDESDCKKLIGEIVKALKLDDKQYNKATMLNKISNAKCNLFSPEDYASRDENLDYDERARIGKFYKVYQIYQSRLRQANAMDFDDILFYMNVLLRDYPEVRAKYQKRFKYIFVDEYQDTNFSQYLIIKKLAAYHQNICVVGDDAQSIYAFRGANIQNILNFKKDYPDAKTFKLEQNYRSTQTIVNAANSVIAKNKNQIQKTVWTANQVGDKIDYFELPTDRDEADCVAKSICRDIAAGEQGKEIAILYRTNSQSRTMEESLRLKNVPYLIYSGTSFYDRKEIKDIIAYFRLVVNNDDEEAFLRIINYPARGIGQTTIDRLKVARDAMKCSLFVAIQKLTPDNPFGIRANTVKLLWDFCRMIESCTQRVYDEDAYTLGKDIIRLSKIKTDLSLLDDKEDKDKLAHVEEFVSGLKAFVETEEENIVDSLTGEEINIKTKTLDVFLQQIALMTNTDTNDNNADDKVRLMTIHTAKGLEFNNVYLVGMEENLFPSNKSFASKDEMEEERRLCYVAMTRAKKHLALSSAKIRYRNGECNFTEPSRFVDEIDESYLNRKNGNLVKRKLVFSDLDNTPSIVSKPKKKLPLTTLKHNAITEPQNRTMLKPKGTLTANDEGWRLADYDEIVVGKEVMHSKFGCGVVKEIEFVASDKRAVVDFGQEGKRTLILKFAKLKIK